MTTADDMTVKTKLFATEDEKLDLTNFHHVQWVLGGLEFAGAALALSKVDLLRVVLTSIVARIDGDAEANAEISKQMDALVAAFKAEQKPVL